MKKIALAAILITAGWNTGSNVGLAQDGKKEPEPVVPSGEILTVEERPRTSEIKIVKTPRGDRLQFEWKGKTYRVRELRVKPKPGENGCYTVFTPVYLRVPVQIPFSEYQKNGGRPQ